MKIDIQTRPSVLQLPSDQNASGRTLGEEEIRLLQDVVRSGVLTSTKGTLVKRLETQFAAMMGVAHVHGCTSGTAAVHTAIAAINPDPGEEIVTTSITDMGALTPILYQGAIPVFADVDPTTCNVTAENIEQVLSHRTRAIIVTHLFGNPCNMDEIIEVARAREIPVIEDCAQAYLARHRGRLVGTFGDVGCFSLQQGKHITTGEGGLIATDDPELARRMFLFINKAWGYGDSKPDHYFLALNYRMSELQGAVATAQLDKLDSTVERRVVIADRLTRELADLPGIEPPSVRNGDVHTYWKYCLRVDPERLPGGTVRLGQLLRERGIASAPRYIQKPAFMCEVFTAQRTFGTSRYPFTLARPEALDYDPSRFGGTFEALANLLVLPLNERYTDEHVRYVVTSIRAAVEQMMGDR